MSRRLIAALAASCAFASAAAAQTDVDPRLAPAPPPPPREEPRSMIPLVPLGDGATFGLGRFSVSAPPRLRTHTERLADPSDLGRSRRGIGGVGFRVTF